MALLMLEARWMPLLLGSANSEVEGAMGLRSPLGASLRDLGLLAGSSGTNSVVWVSAGADSERDLVSITSGNLWLAAAGGPAADSVRPR
jgi:hypothetical protein